MGLKRSCRSTACVGHKHRRLNLHEALLIKETSDAADHLGSLNEGVFHVLIHDQIHISLTISGIGIGQSMMLLRKDLQTLGKKNDLLCMNRDFTCLCLKYLTLYAKDITNIVFLKVRIGLLTDLISCNIKLHFPFQILYITEGCFTHHTLKHHTACQRYFLSL
ncbi:putative uncharacterized protein [Roseburia sp. CAG:380]|nr:putative uncharacterized protein [Roseburia sp. CAG:380]